MAGEDNVDTLAELSQRVEGARELDRSLADSTYKNADDVAKIDRRAQSLKEVQEAKSEAELVRAHSRSPVRSEAEALALYKLEEIRQKFPTGGVR